MKFKSTIQMTVTAAALSACVSCAPNRQIVPLAGEDAKALAYSTDNRQYIEKSAAVMAFEELVKAVRANDVGGCIRAFGPTTMALLNGLARESGRTPAEYWEKGDTGRFVLPGTGKPLTFLKNKTSVAETGSYDPARRDLFIIATVEGAGETRIRAIFAGDRWVFEFLDSLPSSPDRTN